MDDASSSGGSRSETSASEAKPTQREATVTPARTRQPDVIEPFAATAPVFDTPKPSRMGNSVMGVLTGTFVDAAVSYADAIAVVQGHFLANPPPRITYILNGLATNQYTFIAVGRVV